MAKGKGGFIGQDGLNAPDAPTGVSGTAGDEQVTVSWTAPSDVGGSAITGYKVLSNDGIGLPIDGLLGASYDDIEFDVSSQVSGLVGFIFKPDGTKFYVLSSANPDTVYQYSCSTAFDLSTASYDSKSFDLSTQSSNVFGIAFKSDGTKMYIAGTTSDVVYQYTLSTAWDVSTASYDSVSFSVASQDGFPTGVRFKTDGTKMFVSGAVSDSVYQYSLSTAWDISTASYDSQSVSVSGSVNLGGFTFNSDGTKLFMGGDTYSVVLQYDLSTAFDLSTAVDSGQTLTTSSSTQNYGFDVRSDDKKLFIGSSTTTSVRQYSLGEGSTTSTSATVTGLTNGTSYTFNVWAINAFGWSSPSDASGSLTPQAVRALFALGFIYTGGSPNIIAQVTIDQVTVSTTGNATDFGDLTVARGEGSSCSSSTRGIFAGGAGDGSTTHSNVIDYVTILSAGNATDFGDLLGATDKFGGASNDTRGLFFGGNVTGAQNVIQYITIASTGNATDFGDMSRTQEWNTATSSTTRAVTAGGSYAPINTIEYVTISTTGNVTDFGDLTVGREQLAGCSNGTRGCFGGGNGSSNVIDYITLASTGNATDFGDLTTGRSYPSSTAGGDRGLWAGGNPTNSDTIDYVTITSTGNATDFGNLTSAARGGAACSSGHGGLS